MKRKLIILGSSRSDGNTRKMVDCLLEKGNYDLIDLNDYTIGYYDYNYDNKGDDYMPLMRSIIPKYNTFIFATPVYWYSMSAVMKTFVDRLSDLIRIEKDLGRFLRRKKMAMISCSGHDDRSEHFKEPFLLSANYLGMQFLGDVHTFVEDGEKPSAEVRQRLEDFDSLICADVTN